MQEDKVALGNTDVRVTPLGVGAWSWGDTSLWGFGQGYGEGEVRGAFQSTVRAGIDFVDTAEVYGLGRSERLVGEFMRESGRPLVVATKFAPLPWRLRRKSVVNALRRSLDRLGIRCVDLYQIHWPVSPIPIRTWMAGMADAVELGLTRAVGVSNYSPKQTRVAHAELAKRGIPLASNQVEYSLLWRRPEKQGLLETCKSLHVTVISYSPLRKGMLTGKYSPQNLPPGARGKTYDAHYLDKILPLIAMQRQFGDAHGGKTPAQVALNWLICKGTVPIPGAKNARQAQDNAGALGWRLTEKEVAELDRVSLAVI